MQDEDFYALSTLIVYQREFITLSDHCVSVEASLPTGRWI